MSERMQATLGVTGPQRLVIRIVGQTPQFSLTPLGRAIDRVRSGSVEAAISRALRRSRA